MKTDVHSGQQNKDQTAEHTNKQICVAVDGPAGSGKSTLAKKVADALGYLYVDTGAMYRAATWVALEQRASIEDSKLIADLVAKAKIELFPPDKSSANRVRVFVNGADVSFIIRSRIITRFVSAVSAVAGVRDVLVKAQQQLAKNQGVVMDGRDIGTVVLPEAQVKIFLTASPEVRAKRRLKELKEMGQMADFEQIVSEIKARDHLDSTRAIAPLKQAADAVEINTDNYAIDEVVQQVLNLCYLAIAKK